MDLNAFISHIFLFYLFCKHLHCHSYHNQYNDGWRYQITIITLENIWYTIYTVLYTYLHFQIGFMSVISSDFISFHHLKLSLMYYNQICCTQHNINFVNLNVPRGGLLNKPSWHGWVHTTFLNYQELLLNAFIYHSFHFICCKHLHCHSYHVQYKDG